MYKCPKTKAERWRRNLNEEPVAREHYSDGRNFLPADCEVKIRKNLFLRVYLSVVRIQVVFSNNSSSSSFSSRAGNGWCQSKYMC